MVGTLELRSARLSDTDVQRLVAEVQQEYVVRYGGPDRTPLDDSLFEPPQGALFVGYADDEPVAMGGWRHRADVQAWGLRRPAEVKRMYVVERARRRGYARLVLDHLERSAHEHGCDVMVLETGLRQPEAIAMYLAAGYRPIEGFGYYAGEPLSRCFGKPLPTLPTARARPTT